MCKQNSTHYLYCDHVIASPPTRCSTYAAILRTSGRPPPETTHPLYPGKQETIYATCQPDCPGGVVHAAALHRAVEERREELRRQQEAQRRREDANRALQNVVMNARFEDRRRRVEQRNRLSAGPVIGARVARQRERVQEMTLSFRPKPKTAEEMRREKQEEESAAEILLGMRENS